MRKLLACLVLLIGVAGGVSATSRSAAAGDDSHLEFILRFATEDRVDADGDSASSVGDTLVAVDDVLDPESKQTVGRLAIDCVIIAVPTEGDPSELSRCHGTLLQDGGKLLLSTVTTAAELEAKVIDLAVLGGTGRYRGARGDAVNDLTSGESHLIVTLD